MLGAGASRRRIARVLNTAYADGLLSEETFVQRLDQVFGERLVDPGRVIGDLTLRRTPPRWRSRLGRAATKLLRQRARSRSDDGSAVLLALDWTGGHGELLLGRSRDCDVVLGEESVSRRHACLLFRDGHWVIRDLGSTNGTTVNGVTVGRCCLRPGDRVTLGHALVEID